MKVIVCGGRNYSDRKRVFTTLDALHAETPITVLMHGDARGADALADDWAAGKVKTATFTPAWEQHGRAAGPLRNQEMLDAGPDLVVAFPGGHGTADMIQRAVKVGVPVKIVE